MKKAQTKNKIYLVLVLLLAAGIVFWQLYLDPVTGKLNQGLDLAGGIYVIYEGVDTPDNPVTDQSMTMAVEVIRQRIDSLGVTEPNIQRQGRDRIIVELPGISNPEEALEILGTTAMLEFIDESGTVWVTGADLISADAALNQFGQAIVNLDFNSDGARKFEEATRANLNKPLHIMLDGEIISSPTVESVITGGSAIISGVGTMEDAQNLAVMLSSGALPVELRIIETRAVSATLGQDSIDRSITAAIIATAAVLAFMFLLYRIPGLWADVALAIYLVLVLWTLAAINATITLPGIAGLILSIGIAVDANIIIYERIKEELRIGKTLRASIDSGFDNALSTILDANITTLIATTVMFFLGTGPVKGFALTLTIGILVSMFTALVITKFLLRTLARTGWIKNPARLFGVKGAQS